MKNGSVGKLAWDTTNSNDWASTATLNTFLNNDYYNTLSSEAQSQIQNHNFNIGEVIFENSDLVRQIESEKSKTWNGKIGLISGSDYLRVNTNVERCGNFLLNNQNYEFCKLTNYLAQSPAVYSTISMYAESSDYMLIGYSEGTLHYGYADVARDAIWPTLYLKSDITLSGEGTKANPYIIK